MEYLDEVDEDSIVGEFKVNTVDTSYHLLVYWNIS